MLKPLVYQDLIYPSISLVEFRPPYLFRKFCIRHWHGPSLLPIYRYITASPTRPKPAAAALDHTSLFTYNIAVLFYYGIVAITITWNLSKLKHRITFISMKHVQIF